MKIRRGIGRFLKSMFNVRGWIGYDQITLCGRYVYDMVIRLSRLHHHDDAPENFEDAVKRYHLSPQKLEQVLDAYRRQMMIYLGFAAFLFFYTGYLLWGAAYFAAFVSFLLTGLGVMGAFRAHFWMFQIKTRTLGVSLKTWFSSLLKGGLSK